MTVSSANPTIRMAADFECGFAAETAWARALAASTQFSGLALAAENFDQIVIRHRPQDLTTSGHAAPTRALRSHVEGQISAPFNLGLARWLLPAILGQPLQSAAPRTTPRTTPRTSSRTSSLTAPRIIPPQINPISPAILPSGWTPRASLALPASQPAPATPALPSFAFVRRFATDQHWSEFTGLKCAEIDLSHDATSGEGAVLRARFIGASRQIRSRLRHAAVPAAPALGLVADSTALALRATGGAALSAGDGLLVTGWRLHLRRGGMRPVFALASDSPHLISDGVLAITGSLSLLANDAATALLDRLGAGPAPALRLALQLRLDDAAGGGLVFDLPALAVTTYFSRATATAQPAGITLGFELVPPSRSRATAMLRLAEIAASDAGGQG